MIVPKELKEPLTITYTYSVKFIVRIDHIILPYLEILNNNYFGF